jgi:4-amino-4-deoxy-L-arabinose transferase-like glycosyltransferase
MEGSNALEAIETHTFKVFYPENNGREGLYANTVAASIAVFGNSKFAVRLPAAVSGTLTVFGLYCLAAELFTVPIALLASFLLATSFWHIVASRLAGHAIMAPLFLVWTLYFLVHAVIRLGKGNFPLLATLCGGVSLGLGFHSYASFRIAPLLIAPILAIALIQARSAGRLRAFGLLLAGYLSTAIVVCLPLALYFIDHPEMLWNRAHQVSVFQASDPAIRIGRNIWTTAQMFFFRGDANWRHNYSGDRELFWPVALCFLAGCFLAVRDLRDTRNWLRGIIGLGWLFVGAIPVVLSDEGLPHALRSIVFAPPVFLLAAWGAWCGYALAKTKLPNDLLRVGIPLLLLVLSIQPYILYFDSWAKRPEVALAHLAFAENMAKAIVRLPDQTEKYVVLPVQSLPVRGIPLIAQSIMYLTNSFTERGQQEHNIHYVTSENAASLGIAGDPARNLCERVNDARPDAETFCMQ